MGGAGVCARAQALRGGRTRPPFYAPAPPGQCARRTGPRPPSSCRRRARRVIFAWGRKPRFPARHRDEGRRPVSKRARPLGRGQRLQRQRPRQIARAAGAERPRARPGRQGVRRPHPGVGGARRIDAAEPPRPGPAPRPARPRHQPPSPARQRRGGLRLGRPPPATRGRRIAQAHGEVSQESAHTPAPHPPATRRRAMWEGGGAPGPRPDARMEETVSTQTERSARPLSRRPGRAGVFQPFTPWAEAPFLRGDAPDHGSPPDGRRSATTPDRQAGLRPPPSPPLDHTPPPPRSPAKRPPRATGWLEDGGGAWGWG